MILLLIYISQLTFFAFNIETVKAGVSECEVVQFYEIITPEQGTKVLTKSGEVEEATFIL